VARRSDHTKAELKDLVIDATAALIEEYRTVKVTARQIAERVGYTPGTLYTHFENLDDIFLHVNARSLADLRNILADAVAREDSPQRAIRAMGLAYLDYARSQPHRFQLMFTPRLPNGAAPPAFLQAEIERLFDLLGGQLQRIGETDDNTLAVGVRALWSGVHGVASLALSDQLFASGERVERDMVKLLVAQFVSAWPPEELESTDAATSPE
jgi:AcrR family transcriptional regulator